MAVENLDYEIDQLVRAYDETFMPLPDLDSEPHLLISKVRRHYMEYVIKLLSINYETNQRLPNKNIYLPSAIWRCAKNIEMNAAQACMVVQLYRKNIVSVVNELKNDTKKGKLNKKLYECLNKPPINDKKTQTRNTATENKCHCGMNKRKKRCGNSTSPRHKPYPPDDIVTNENSNNYIGYCKIPVTNETAITHSSTPMTQAPDRDSPHPEHRPSVDSDPDELMKQLEKLFQGDPNDDDIFAGTLCDRYDNTLDDTKKVTNILEMNKVVHDSVIENHAAQIKSLDERLASLTGLLINNDNSMIQKTDNQKYKKNGSSKWLCEEYYLKVKLYELLDQIGDHNRKSLEKIKVKFLYYFGQDSDDEGIISPLDETPEFVVSCKERIAPWVVKMLTPYYIKGNIKGKSIFKSLAKHLIRLIYQCSRYPEEYEVTSFVADFLKNHKIIRCEADFKEFRIENI